MKFKTKFVIFIGAFIGAIISTTYYAAIFYLLYQVLSIFTSFYKVVVAIIGVSAIYALFYVRRKENEEDLFLSRFFHLLLIFRAVSQMESIKAEIFFSASSS